MRFNKVLLVRFPYHTYLGDASSIPVGLGYVAESLEVNNIDYAIFDMGLDYTEDQLINKIKELKPDLLGITMMTMHHLFHYKIITNIKNIFPELKIVVGGPHASTYRIKMLEGCEQIDFGIVLEGEESIVELCKGVPFINIKGLIFRENNQIIYNGDREFIINLDNIPFPKYRKFEINKYLAGTFGIHTTRGCPFECIYCPVKTAIGKRFRVRSPHNVVSEIEYWHNKGYNNFAMWDDNFTMIQKRVHEICDLLEIKNFNNLRISVPNGIRGDKADFNLLSKMKNVGFQMISFGIESAENKVLAGLKKGTQIETMEEAVKNAVKLGYDICLYFIIGSPNETYKDFEKSYAFAQKYPVIEARFYNIIPFPNTELFDWITKNNYFLRQPEEYLNTADHFINEPCFETPEFTLKERKKAFKKGWKLTNTLKIKSKARELHRLGPFKYIVSMFLLSYTYRKLFKNKYFRKHVIYLLRDIFKVDR